MTRNSENNTTTHMSFFLFFKVENFKSALSFPFEKHVCEEIIIKSVFYFLPKLKFGLAIIKLYCAKNCICFTAFIFIDVISFKNPAVQSYFLWLSKISCFLIDISQWINCFLMCRAVQMTNINFRWSMKC